MNLVVYHRDFDTGGTGILPVLAQAGSLGHLSTSLWWTINRFVFIVTGFLVLGVVLVCSVCGGGGQEFNLTVINVLQSTQIIRVDLGGDIRTLNLGDLTIYRMVQQNQHILSVESTACSGTVRDTLQVSADLTVRILATQDASSGACRMQFTVTPTTRRIPLSVLTF